MSDMSLQASQRARRRSTALEDAHEQLVHMIDLGVFRAGQRLPRSDELAAMVGVSRPVLLQALRVLEGQGRVQVRRGSGTWVATLNADNVDGRRAQIWQNRAEILQMCAMREMLEIGVARRLAVRGLSSERIARAWSLIEEMGNSSDLDVQRPMDLAFHSVLTGGLGMPIVERTLRDARARVSAVFEFLSWPANRGHQSTEEHKRLLEAVIARDPDEAARVASEHISVASTLVERLLGGDGAGILNSPLPGSSAANPDPTSSG